MKIEGYEEISHEEYLKLGDDERAFFYDLGTKETYHFKKAQKFPIVFEGRHKTFSITKDGWFEIRSKAIREEYQCIKQDFPLLVKAVEKAKEVMKKE